MRSVYLLVRTNAWEFGLRASECCQSCRDCNSSGVLCLCRVTVRFSNWFSRCLVSMFLALAAHKAKFLNNAHGNYGNHEINYNLKRVYYHWFVVTMFRSRMCILWTRICSLLYAFAASLSPRFSWQVIFFAFVGIVYQINWQHSSNWGRSTTYFMISNLCILTNTIL